ncbi:MAG: hypothetical protein RR853_09155 [Aurantimicrobium sp.]|uniref:hypothetical protein n=1 Tax=Aurantimicrobium sp. TaxID=1930784 RepID=UPI002FC9A8FA
MSEKLTTAAQLLKTEIERTKFEDGTVITFDRTIKVAPGVNTHRKRSFDDLFDEEDEDTPEYGPLRTEEKTLTYAALFVGGRWFFTGKGSLGTSKVKSSKLIEMLSEPNISNVKVATGFEPIDD